MVRTLALLITRARSGLFELAGGAAIFAGAYGYDWRAGAIAGGSMLLLKAADWETRPDPGSGQ